MLAAVMHEKGKGTKQRGGEGEGEHDPSLPGPILYPPRGFSADWTVSVGADADCCPPLHLPGLTGVDVAWVRGILRLEAVRGHPHQHRPHNLLRGTRQCARLQPMLMRILPAADFRTFFSGFYLSPVSGFRKDETGTTVLLAFFENPHEAIENECGPRSCSVASNIILKWTMPGSSPFIVCVDHVSTERPPTPTYLAHRMTPLYLPTRRRTSAAATKQGMFSWFPLYIPLRTPVVLKPGDKVSAHFWRCTSSTKVWYEWALTSPAPSPIHNPNGRSYWIGL